MATERNGNEDYYNSSNNTSFEDDEEDDDDLAYSSSDSDASLITKKHPLIQSLDREIQRKTEILALAKLEHGPVHINIVRAYTELAQTYIRSNAVQAALDNVEKALRMNVNLSEILKQQEENLMFQKDGLFDMYDVKQQCDKLSHSILLTIALIHLKMGNLTTCETLVTKVKLVQQKIFHNLKQKQGVKSPKSDEELGIYDSDSVELDEEMFPLMLIYARIYTEVNKFEEAEKILEEAWSIKEHVADEQMLLVPVYLLLARVHIAKARTQAVDSDDFAQSVARAINYYEQVIPYILKYNHGYGVDHLMVQYELIGLFSAIHNYDRALEIADDVVKQLDEISYHQLNLIRQSNMYTSDQLLYFLKWTCQVKMTQAFILVKRSKYQEACKLLIHVIKFNESVLVPSKHSRNPMDSARLSTVSSLDPPQLNVTGISYNVLNSVETADLYKKLGTMYMLMHQIHNATTMYKRALLLLYTDKRHEETQQMRYSEPYTKKTKSQQQQHQQYIRDRDEMIRDLLERTAKLNLTQE